MLNDYLTQTEIGRHFRGGHREQATSHEVGRWLCELGFRDQFGEPTWKAKMDELVSKKASRGNAQYPVYVWHPVVIEILEKAGHQRFEGFHCRSARASQQVVDAE